MGKTDERLNRTAVCIGKALADSHGYHNCRMDGFFFPLHVYFGEADCCITTSFGGNYGARMELLIGVPADWLETVHAPGLALVNGAVILQALPLGLDYSFPEGVEQAWMATAIFLQTHAGAGIEPKPQFIARFGDETNRGETLEKAMEWCVLNIRGSLGI